MTNIRYVLTWFVSFFCSLSSLFVCLFLFLWFFSSLFCFYCFLCLFTLFFLVYLQLVLLWLFFCMFFSEFVLFCFHLLLSPLSLFVSLFAAFLLWLFTLLTKRSGARCLLWFSVQTSWQLEAIRVPSKANTQHEYKYGNVHLGIYAKWIKIQIYVHLWTQ